MEKLVSLYVAEGFVSKVQERKGMTVEDMARMSLKELEKRYLVDIIEGESIKSYGSRKHPIAERVTFCSVPDLALDLSIEEATKEGFVHFAENLNVAKRVALNESASLLEGASPSLQTVLDFTKPTSLHFLGFKMLKVLDLEGTQVRTLPEEIGDLINLAYLGLRDSKIAIVPESIGKLSNLLTLDLGDSLVVDLPKDMWKIANIRHVQCRCEPTLDGTYLRDLQTLDGARMGPWIEDAPVYLPNLLSLTMFGTPKLNDACHRMPQSLVEVRLFDMCISEKLWLELQRMPSLRALHLVCCLTLKELTCNARRFSKLQELAFIDLINLKSWNVEQGTMPSLETLSLVRCRGLLMHVDSLKHIIAKDLNCIGMSSPFVVNLETAKSCGAFSGANIQIMPSENRQTQIINNILNLIDKVVLPTFDKHTFAEDCPGDESTNELQQVADELLSISNDMKYARHSIRWAFSGHPWAKMWLRKHDAVYHISNRCLNLLQAMKTTVQCSQSMRLESHAEELLAIGKDLKKLRKMGLTYKINSRESLYR